MVAGEEHLGHRPATEDLGAGVVRVLQQALGVGVLEGGAGVAQHAGRQARHRIHDDHSRDLPAGQNVVAY